MMKRQMNHAVRLAALAAAAVLSAACSKDDSRPSPSQGGRPASLLVEVGRAGAVKSPGVKEDSLSAIHSVQAFAYRTDAGHEGELAATGWSDGKASVSLKLTATDSGTDYDVWVVVNNRDRRTGGWKYDLGKYPSPSAAEAVITSLTDNFTADGGGGMLPDLLMTGGSRVTVRADNVHNSLTVDVARLVSKVELRSIAVEYTDDPEAAQGDLVLDAVYLVNAARDITLGGSTPDVQTWCNPGERRKSSCDPAVFDTVGVRLFDSSLGKAAQYGTVHTFLTCANPAGKNVTKLVFACSYGPERERMYYIAELGEILPGKAYIITCARITGRGSTDPYVPVTPRCVSVKVEVEDWIEDYLGEGGSVTL